MFNLFVYFVLVITAVAIATKEHDVNECREQGAGWNSPKSVICMKNLSATVIGNFNCPRSG